MPLCHAPPPLPGPVQPARNAANVNVDFMPKKTPTETAPKAGADGTADLDAGIAQFETALEELEGLIDSLEQGEVSLEDGLKQFERGVELARGCQRTLKAAEQRVKSLLEDDPQGDLLDFHQDPEV